MTRLLALALISLIAAPAAADSQDTLWGDGYVKKQYDYDADARAWQETEAALPPYPRAEGLVEFSVGPGTRRRHFIDPASLQVGADGVVRYSVVIRGEGGAQNVNFEGLRCATGERKLYAFGRPDKNNPAGGVWSPNRRARWETIPARQADSYHRELFFHYLCTVDTAGDLNKILKAVHGGGVRHGE